jgi:hypothetical protein
MLTARWRPPAGEREYVTQKIAFTVIILALLVAARAAILVGYEVGVTQSGATVSKKIGDSSHEVWARGDVMRTAVQGVQGHLPGSRHFTHRWSMSWMCVVRTSRRSLA